MTYTKQQLEEMMERNAETTANFADILPPEYLEKCAAKMLARAQDKQKWLNEFWGVIAQKTALSAARRVYERE